MGAGSADGKARAQILAQEPNDDVFHALNVRAGAGDNSRAARREELAS